MHAKHGPSLVQTQVDVEGVYDSACGIFSAEEVPSSIANACFASDRVPNTQAATRNMGRCNGQTDSCRATRRKKYVVMVRAPLTLRRFTAAHVAPAQGRALGFLSDLAEYSLKGPLQAYSTQRPRVPLEGVPVSTAWRARCTRTPLNADLR